jgi:NAD(P)-dependent dehydrogenase (short-subunit alcohol dehydrogenase family)
MRPALGAVRGRFVRFSIDPYGSAMELRDRVVVITGAGSGIGEALARAVSAEGARHVVVADLDRANAERVAAEIGGTAFGLDVSDEAALRAMVEDVETAHGPIDVFVSNAGFVTSGGVEDTNERIQKMWEVHVLAHIYAARAVLPSMITRGEGYLLNTASAAGLLTQLGSLSYSITKHAAVALAEWLAITHHHQGIRVSVLCPQAVSTNIVRNSPDRGNEALGGESLGSGVAAQDGVVTPAEVAQKCVDAMRAEQFWVLPHTEVATYVERKATDIDRWLAGMRRFQGLLYADGPLPGDAIAPPI